MLHSLLLLYLVSVQRAGAQQQEGGLGPGSHLRPQVELESEVRNHGEGLQIVDMKLGCQRIGHKGHAGWLAQCLA